MYLHSVAPKELIAADYEVLRSYEHLETTQEIEDLLFMQSLEGRSHNGAGVFDKRTYVNTTIDDVVVALGRDRLYHATKEPNIRARPDDFSMAQHLGL